MITIRNLFKKKNPADKELFKSEIKLPRSIYDPEGTTMKDHIKKFHFTHYILKYKILLPAMVLLKKILNKKLLKNTPLGEQFLYLKVFEESFDESLADWGSLFIHNRSETENKVSKREIRDRMKNYEAAVLTKQVFLTIVSKDTAYLEFLPIFFSNLSKKMLDTPKNHLMYTSGNTFDKRYFALFPVITSDGSLQLKTDSGNTECRQVTK